MEIRRMAEIASLALIALLSQAAFVLQKGKLTTDITNATPQVPCGKPLKPRDQRETTHRPQDKGKQKSKQRKK